jgi:probable phosphoglycerate mutase
VKEVGHCDNTGVSCLEVDGDKVTIVFENDNSHLDESTSTFAGQSWWKKDGKGSLDDANLWFRPLDFASESEFYYQSRKEAWMTIHGSLQSFDGDGFLRDAKAQSQRDPRSVMVAMQGQKVAGLLQMDFQRDAEKGVGGIPFYYMTPDCRKKGLGVQLLGQAVSTYRPMGRNYLRLRCAPDNLAAQRFYQRHGFRKVAEEQGSRVPLDIMEKYIGYDRAWLSEVPFSDAP